eukprot:77763_1
MLLTDGNITTSRNRYTIRWGQKYDSYPMLDSIRTVTQSTHHIAFGTQKVKSKIYPTCNLALASKHLTITAHGLLGCSPGRKTFDLIYPHSIDPAYASSLIRGIVDGDGCWVLDFKRTQNNPRIYFSLCSASITFLQSVRKVINGICLESSSDLGRIYPTGSNFRLNYHCKSELNQIGEWMYNTNKTDIDNGLVLPKKLNRF